MPNSSSEPPLTPRHPDTLLSSAKLAEMDRRATDVLQNSLLPGQKEPLKTRPDGTILDGHHRIYILRRRGVDVDALPREIVVKGGL
jgi:ParB-like chromosome segregation protein Spo0J